MRKLHIHVCHLKKVHQIDLHLKLSKDPLVLPSGELAPPLGFGPIDLHCFEGRWDVRAYIFSVSCLSSVFRVS